MSLLVPGHTPIHVSEQKKLSNFAFCVHEAKHRVARTSPSIHHTRELLDFEARQGAALHQQLCLSLPIAIPNSNSQFDARKTRGSKYHHCGPMTRIAIHLRHRHPGGVPLNDAEFFSSTNYRDTDVYQLWLLKTSPVPLVPGSLASIPQFNQRATSASKSSLPDLHLVSILAMLAHRWSALSPTIPIFPITASCFTAYRLLNLLPPSRSTHDKLPSRF